jgi:hypothetical protein
MRRRVLAEHGNDYQKVLEWYVELGKQRVEQNGGSRTVQSRMVPHAGAPDEESS